MGRFRFCGLRGSAYRATSYDTPLWVFPNRRPGRWSDPDDGTVAQYCSLDPAAPLAEVVRHEDIGDAALAAEIRMSVWELRLTAGAVLDLSSSERAADQGVDWATLVDDDWDACQELAREVVADGGRGILAPSAALPGSLSLTVFGPCSEIAWTAEPRLAIQVPAREIFHGAPGAGVVAATRRFGEPYRAGAIAQSAAHLLDR